MPSAEISQRPFDVKLSDEKENLIYSPASPTDADEGAVEYRYGLLSPLFGMIHASNV